MTGAPYRIAGLALIVAAATVGTTWADDPTPFYRNRTLTIDVSAAAGGGLDTYARLISRHLGDHIPGNPRVVVANMPGAGGQVVARHMLVRAAKDGTEIGTFFPSVLVDAILGKGQDGIGAGRLTFIGNAKAEASVCMVRRDLSMSVGDLTRQELALGGTSAGSQVVDFPIVERNLLGLKFKLTPGYQGTREVGTAIERGEVQGICGVGWSTIKVQYPDVLKGTFGKIFAQEDMKGDPELNAAGVPLISSFATSDLQRQVLAILYSQNDLARPYVAPPEVPADRIAILQKAFLETLASKELQDDAAAMHVDVEAMSGDAMRSYIQKLFDSPPEALKTLAESYKP